MWTLDLHIQKRFKILGLPETRTPLKSDVNVKIAIEYN